MPYQDKTGPMGKGPRTGREMGLCVSNKDIRRDFPRRELPMKDTNLCLKWRI